jgi:hypothetical protein
MPASTESRRVRFRKDLSSLYLPYYDALCGVLPEEWQPVQGLRTVAEQDVLYRKGRIGPPASIVTWAKGGQSAHNYGCASDWVKFEGQRILWELEDWSEYQQALEKVGLRWGADWNRNGRTDDEKKIDRPHNELVITCSWSHVYEILSKNGMRTAQEHIEANLAK